ncbi:MAG TPA: Mpo1-like protein [Flavobacteriaceae bacterium]|nr:Mpo1-like protein [Flavobacteriaceae bacterium]
MSVKLQSLLDEYSESHQNNTNKAIHWICVPLIFWAIIALLYSIPNSGLIDLIGDKFYANWAVFSMIPVLVYYLSLSVPISIGMFLFISGCLYVSDIVLQTSTYPLWAIALVVFALAWVGQFYGHKIEGKKPSFLKDIQFLLIGPAWLMHFIYKRLGLKY